AYECKSPAHMLFQHATAAPNLRGLPPNDIPVVQRALSKNPAERWPTCSAFLEALMDTAFSSTIHETVQNLSGSSLLIRKARLARSRADAPRPVSAMEAPPPPASPSTIAGASNRGSSSLFSAPPVTATRESRALPGSTARPVPPPTTPVLDTNPALDEVIELAAVPPPPVPASPVPAPQPAHRPTPFAPPCAPTPRLLRSQLSRPSLTLEQPATHAIRLPKVWSIAPVSLLTGGTAIPDYHPSTTEFTDALVRAAMPNGTKPPLPGELIHDVHGWECRFPVKLMAGMLELKVIALSEAWRAELEWADAHTAILRLHQSGGLFAKLAGRKAGLEVTIAFSPSNKVLGEAVVTGRIFGNPDADFTRFASVTLPRMVDDAHSAIGNHTDRRIHSRVPAEFPLQLFPVTTEGVVYDAIMGRCRNVSLGGVCFDTATGVMPTGYVYTAFPGLGATHGWAILTRLLRSHREATGTHVFAGRFRSEY
ncbi:MAG: hypothetical protein LC104_05025, partial [Bacteroidales bacterium]|nr:hypothetical protein [Bacteroidales bacterium]